jgi:PIN domain nuclease of toxin-antitoxin system
MKCGYLLDTHIAVRWLAHPRKLTRTQSRVLATCARRQEPVGISVVSLLEIAVVFGADSTRETTSATELLSTIEASSAFEVVPLTFAIAAEAAALGSALRDPGDRAIVATARVFQLQLLTSDERIIQSGLARVVR